ncbi:site-specific integrase [Ferruginibacter paludis]|uniref:tyrosine-type recombinase/integrase n=1 Tax=Ferruginibacter paludis TaxID=1310417 RepID=UPI0025B2F295|nr:site-specific integrase [Ferruginibacter paludis]MDN3658918.1 site-specific integrase [Ferruginibacter paludis]
MGTIRFVLRKDKPNKDNFSPIELIYQLSGRRKYFRTKEKLFSFNWNEKEQRAVYLDKKEVKKLLPAIDLQLLPSAKEIAQVNDNLASLKKEIADIERRFELNKVVYSVEMLVEELKHSHGPATKSEAPNNQVFDFIDKYILDNKDSREPGSMSVYKSVKNHLQNFQIEKKKKVTFDKIDYSFFLEFQNYLINVRNQRIPNGLGNVTIAKLLSTVKTFLNYAKMHGIEVSNKYKDFTIKKENLEVIALTNDEFETLFNFDFSENKRLGQVRDVFCFSCATGLRYSDLAQLKREHIKKDEIRLTVTKTKQNLSIPLNPYSDAILAKYSKFHKPLPVISNQKMNDYLKELCELAKIDEPVQIVRFRGSKREEISHPKYELISVHTGRKTFCTLSLEKGMSAEETMQISGHRDYASFKRYINITEQRSKIVMKKAWGEI